MKLLRINVAAWLFDAVTEGVVKIFPLRAEYLYERPGFGTMLFKILNIYRIIYLSRRLSRE